MLGDTNELIHGKRLPQYFYNAAFLIKPFKYFKYCFACQIGEIFC